ncbi:MAG: efflux RND transporter periplasmic adaptor subunit [Armatimonadetes bacterium]|nr:efflux RND transporter periplasmic adaptor subunit [Armatimonadota bacterium]
MRLRWIRPILAAVVVALAIWQVSLLLGVLQTAQQSDEVPTAAVERGEFVVGITREGAIESANVLSVRAPRSGSTITWIIDDGTEVKQGDLIAQLDTKEYRFEVERQRLDYENRLAQVEQERRDRTRDYESAQMEVDRNLRALGMLGRAHTTETEQAQAQVSYDRWNVNWADQYFQKQSRLSVSGIVPETQVEQSERELRSREHALTKSEKDSEYLGAEHASEQAQSSSDIDTAEFEAELSERRIGEAVQSAQDRAQMAEEQLEEMRKQLAEGELRAPISGVVMLGTTWAHGNRRKFQEGDRVWSRRKVADITQLTELQVELRVEEASIRKLRLGQAAVMTVKTAPDKKFAGELTSIGAVAHEVDAWEDPHSVPGQRVFDVTVTILDEDLSVLRPGMDAQVQFVAERIPEATYVPLEAVFDRPQGQIVYVQKGDKFVPQAVKTGPRNEEAVVILEGLQPGARVALSEPAQREAS